MAWSAVKDAVFSILQKDEYILKNLLEEEEKKKDQPANRPSHKNQGQVLWNKHVFFNDDPNFIFLLC